MLAPVGTSIARTYAMPIRPQTPLTVSISQQGKPQKQSGMLGSVARLRDGFRPHFAIPTDDHIQSLLGNLQATKSYNLKTPEATKTRPSEEPVSLDSEPLQKVQDLFKKADLNQDGKINIQELNAYKAQAEEQGLSDDIDQIDALLEVQADGNNQFDQLVKAYGDDAKDIDLDSLSGIIAGLQEKEGPLRPSSTFPQAENILEEEMKGLISLLDKADSNQDHHVTESELKSFRSTLKGGEDADRIDELLKKNQNGDTNWKRLSLAFGVDDQTGGTAFGPQFFDGEFYVNLNHLKENTQNWQQFLDIYTKNNGVDPQHKFASGWNLPDRWKSD